MSRHISDLHTVLAQLIVEHRKLLDLLEAQHTAMKAFNLSVMADLMPRQEMARLCIVELENKRRSLMRQIMAVHKLPEEPRLAKMAELFPQHAPILLKNRSELRDLAGRILAGAAQRAGLYTRRGIPRVGSRIGVMDAIG
jgi:hypothetical protein